MHNFCFVFLIYFRVCLNKNMTILVQFITCSWTVVRDIRMPMSWLQQLHMSPTRCLLRTCRYQNAYPIIGDLVLPLVSVSWWCSNSYAPVAAFRLVSYESTEEIWFILRFRRHSSIFFVWGWIIFMLWSIIWRRVAHIIRTSVLNLVWNYPR
jgi:hypothetical protein